MQVYEVFINACVSATQQLTVGTRTCAIMSSADLYDGRITDGLDLPTMYKQQACSFNFMWRHILRDT